MTIDNKWYHNLSNTTAKNSRGSFPKGQINGIDAVRVSSQGRKWVEFRAYRGGQVIHQGKSSQVEPHPQAILFERPCCLF